MLGKIILSLFLLGSASLLLYFPIKDYQQLPDSRTYSEVKTRLGIQIAGFSLLFFALFCAIWIIPEREQEERDERPTKKEAKTDLDDTGKKNLTEEEKESLEDGTYTKKD